ncbi:LADA_0F10198g1_1 [Lachancea dasiensis]|uniref:LADA_0F10198g1_1 n=1 Tax=Lachancea dasiensis TaxID=1072105 RepID=A0A1G4JM86_9SACH|nr:LADA_0F10198g1_1 [Lachancea dasiensis]
MGGEANDCKSVIFQVSLNSFVLSNVKRCLQNWKVHKLDHLSTRQETAAEALGRVRGMVPPLIYKAGSRGLNKGLFRTLAVSFGPSPSVTIEASDDGHSEPLKVRALMQQLSDQTRKYESRALAARELSNYINVLSTESVLSSWNGANDLLQPGIPPTARHAALLFLHACLKRLSPSMNDTLRLAFYFSLMDNTGMDCEKSPRMEPELDTFIACLSAITDGGVSFASILEPQGEIYGLGEFLHNTLIHLADDEERNVAASTIKATLTYLLSCVDNGLQLSEDSLPHIIDIANLWEDDDDIRRVSLEILVRHIVILPHISESALSGTLILFIRMQNINAHLNCEPNGMLCQLFAGKSGNNLFRLFLDLEIKDEQCSRYFMILINLLTQKEFTTRWQEPSTSPKYLGTLLTRLFLEVYKGSEPHEVVQCLILTSFTKMLGCREFLNYMKTYPQFWQTAGTNQSSTTVFQLLGEILQKEQLNSPIKHRIQSVFGYIIHLSLTEKYSLIGCDDLSTIIPILLPCGKFLDSKMISQVFQLLNKNAQVCYTWLNEIITNFYEIDGPSTTRCYSVDLIIKIIKEAPNVELRTSNFLLGAMKRLLCNMSTEVDGEVVSRLADLYSEGCRSLSKELVEGINNDVITPMFTTDAKRGRSARAHLGFTSSLLSNPDNKRSIAENCASLAVWSITHREGEIFSSFYCLLIQIVKYAQQVSHVELCLTAAKVLTKIHCRDSDEVVIMETNDVEGISTALHKNSKVKTAYTGSKWSFPEEIPHLKEAQRIAFSGSCRLPTFGENVTVRALPTIDIRLWVSVAISILEEPYDWEVYSYLLTYMCPQFASLVSLRTIDDLIIKYLDVICRHLKQGTSLTLNLPGDISTDDLYIAHIRCLSSILGYHSYLPKSFSDVIVDSLLHGIQSSEKAMIPVLHLLTICSQEVPSSVKRYLTPILVQLQTRITTSFTTPAILEFLLALSDSPLIISHLTPDELKRVLAIAFKLIQSSKDLKRMATIQNIVQNISYTEQDADFTPSTQSFTISPSIAHFFLTLSYIVISSWFLRMRIPSRTELAPFVVKNLIAIASDEYGDEDFDARSYLEAISRFTTSRDDTASFYKILEDRPHEGDEKFSFGRWALPDKIVSIETQKSTGASRIVVRSCCNVDVLSLQMADKCLPETHDIFSLNKQDSEPAKPSGAKPLYTSSYMFMRLGSFGKMALNVTGNRTIAKSVQLLDKIPFTKFHKIGLLYIGPKQFTETEILSNTDGSRQYTKFLSQLGQVIQLAKSDNSYVGGLEADSDGQYALTWRDEKTQVVFHTVTLMPNNVNDPQCSLKKRHVGNDFVSIFYDESGSPDFDFNLIKSQFNFINIVIKPLGSGNCENFKVRMYRKSGVPAFFSTSHFKILSSENLAKYVRQVSVVADTFAASWFASSAPDMCTTWARRAKYLKEMYDKALKMTDGEADGTNPLDFTTVI